MSQSRRKVAVPTADHNEYNPAYVLSGKDIPELLSTVHGEAPELVRQEPVQPRVYQQREDKGRATATESGYEIPLNRPPVYIDIKDEDNVYDYIDDIQISAMIPRKDA